MQGQIVLNLIETSFGDKFVSCIGSDLVDDDLEGPSRENQGLTSAVSSSSYSYQSVWINKGTGACNRHAVGRKRMYFHTNSSPRRTKRKWVTPVNKSHMYDRRGIRYSNLDRCRRSSSCMWRHILLFLKCIGRTRPLGDGTTGNSSGRGFYRSKYSYECKDSEIINIHIRRSTMFLQIVNTEHKARRGDAKRIKENTLCNAMLQAQCVQRIRLWWTTITKHVTKKENHF